ncbi:MAG: hypothetical protein ACJ789_21220 [Thermomicrobiales bacterium]
MTSVPSDPGQRPLALPSGIRHESSAVIQSDAAQIADALAGVAHAAAPVIVKVGTARALAQGGNVSIRLTHPETGRGVTLRPNGSLVPDNGVEADLHVVWDLGRRLRVWRRTRPKRGRPADDPDERTADFLERLPGAVKKSKQRRQHFPLRAWDIAYDLGMSEDTLRERLDTAGLTLDEAKRGQF